MSAGRQHGVKKRVVAALFVLVSACFAIGQTQPSKTNYTVYQIRGDVKAPQPISTPVAAPPESVDKHLKVRISFVVAPDGSVADVKLLKRSTPEFDDYAVSAVRKWKFEPATKDGTPVAVRLETEMHSHQ
jgi:TonB family protein